MKSTVCPQEYITFAQQVADEVGELHRRHFRQPIPTEIKDGGSPVTLVDKEVEALVRRMIGVTYPNHGVIGEEYPPTYPDAEYVWVVDPLDGTRLFLTGKPHFSLLLALAHRGKFILGIIDHAVLGERWIGADSNQSSLRLL